MFKIYFFFFRQIFLNLYSNFINSITSVSSKVKMVSYNFSFSMIFRNYKIIFIKVLVTTFTFISTFIINKISRFKINRNIFNSLSIIIVNLRCFSSTTRTSMLICVLYNSFIQLFIKIPSFV